jgi:hypothetical protein
VRSLAKLRQCAAAILMGNHRPSRKLALVPEVGGRQRRLPLIAVGTYAIADAEQRASRCPFVAGRKVRENRPCRVADYCGDRSAGGVYHEYNGLAGPTLDVSPKLVDFIRVRHSARLIFSPPRCGRHTWIVAGLADIASYGVS